MNVLYDISGLGDFLLSRHALTGVPRVIENVLHGLAALEDEDCRVTACAPTSPHLAQLYFKDRLAGTGLTSAHTPAERTLGKLVGEADRQLRLSLPRRDWTWRLLRKLSLPAIRRADTYFGRLPSELLWSADIYHSPHGPIPAQIRNRPRGTRPQVVLTVYDLIPFKHPEFFLPGMAESQRAILNTLHPDEDWYLCISECTKKDLCELFGIDPRRAFVTPLAADSKVFYPCPTEVSAPVRQRYGIPAGPYLMSLCTLEPRKNVRTIIEGFAHLVHSGEIEDMHLLLVGGKGWLDDGLQEILNRWPEVRQRIILPGFVPDEDLAPLYSGAFCFAYLSYYEGFGLPPLEAMRCGTPVLVANTSSLPEVVGDAGRLLPADDAVGFAREVITLWQNPTRHTQLSVLALERARQFSWKRCAQDTVAAYRSMLAA